MEHSDPNALLPIILPEDSQNSAFIVFKSLRKFTNNLKIKFAGMRKEWHHRRVKIFLQEYCHLVQPNYMQMNFFSIIHSKKKAFLVS